MQLFFTRMAVLAAAASVIAPVAKAEDAYVKVGVTLTSLADQGKTYGDGAEIPGSDYNTNSVTHATLTGGYFFWDHFALEASINSPATTQNVPGGTLAGLPNFGDDTFVTTDATVTYHPERDAAMSPYFGFGVRHHFTIKGTNGPLVNNFHIGSGTGLLLQGGVDYNFSDQFAAFIDVKKAYYNTIGTGDLGPEHIVAHAKLDPVSVEFGVAYRFGGGDAVAPDNDAPSGAWFLKVGATRLSLSDKLNLSVGGTPFAGAKLNTDSQYTPSIQLGWNFYDHFAAVLTAGLPPTVDASGGGTATSLGKLSQVTYGPSALVIEYRPLTEGFFRPYIGAGGSYMIVFKSTDAGVLAKTHMTNDLAPVLEAGADFMVTDRFGFYAEVKKAWLETRTTGTLFGAPVVGMAPIHPLVASVGTVFQF
jgi:outer membrane protein